MDLVLMKAPALEADASWLSLIDGDIQMAGEDLTGCMELVSCNYGMHQQMTTDVSNQARTSGRPNLNDITVVKYLDTASPLIYKSCLGAKPIDDGDADPTKIYMCRNANFEGDENILGSILTLELHNCMVSSIQAQSHPNDMATEQLTLNFTEIHWSATHQGVDANVDGMVEFGWSVARNRTV